jgi:hypothetical protein
MMEDLSVRNKNKPAGENPLFLARFGGQIEEEEVQRLDSDRSHGRGDNVELIDRNSGNKMTPHEDYQGIYTTTTTKK